MKGRAKALWERLKLVPRDNLSSDANAMTFKLLLAFFPFLLFLMTVAGFLELDFEAFVYDLDEILPPEILALVGAFGQQVAYVRMAGLLYVSLAVSIFSSTSAFRTLVVGINRAHCVGDSRHPVTVWLVSFMLVSIFAVSIFLTMAGLVFRSALESFLYEMGLVYPPFLWVFNLLAVALTVAFVTATVVLINYVSLCKKIPLARVLPGSAFTAAVWFAASFGFGFFVDNISQMALIYGSVAAVMVLMVWLNVICHVLLLGGALNAAIHGSKGEK